MEKLSQIWVLGIEAETCTYFLETHSSIFLFNSVNKQFSFDPQNTKKKSKKEVNPDHYCSAYSTYRSINKKVFKKKDKKEELESVNKKIFKLQFLWVSDQSKVSFCISSVSWFLFFTFWFHLFLYYVCEAGNFGFLGKK